MSQCVSHCCSQPPLSSINRKRGAMPLRRYCLSAQPQRQPLFYQTGQARMFSRRQGLCLGQQSIINIKRCSHGHPIVMQIYALDYPGQTKKSIPNYSSADIQFSHRTWVTTVSCVNQWLHTTPPPASPYRQSFRPSAGPSGRTCLPPSPATTAQCQRHAAAPGPRHPDPVQPPPASPEPAGLR